MHNLSMICFLSLMTAGCPREPHLKMKPRTAPRVVGQAMVVAEDGSVRIESRLQGKMVRVMVKEGDAVTAGQILAEMDPGPFRSMVQLRRAELDIALHSEALVHAGSRPAERRHVALLLQAAVVKQQMAARNHQREEQLAEMSSAVSVERRERARDDLDLARLEAQQQSEHREVVLRGPTAAERAIAAARVQVAREQLALAVRELEESTIRAPHSAVVTSRRIGPGDVIGFGTSRVLFELVDPERVELQIEFDETDAASVALGAPVEVLHPRTSEGRVTLSRITRVAGALALRTNRIDDVLLRADGRVLRAWAPLGPKAFRVGSRFDVAIARDTELEDRSATTLSQEMPLPSKRR